MEYPDSGAGSLTRIEPEDLLRHIINSVKCYLKIQMSYIIRVYPNIANTKARVGLPRSVSDAILGV